MKRTRIITAAVFAALDIALTAEVCKVWHAQGCGLSSLLMAVIFYSAFFFGFWRIADNRIKGNN